MKSNIVDSINYGVRLFLPNSNIKYISTEKDILYSYQLYTDKAIARWDNEPHYPGFNNYPHHFHYKENIGASVLSGNPIHDVNKICSFVKGIIGNI